MIAASDFSSDAGLSFINGSKPASTTMTNSAASFAQSLNNSVQTGGTPGGDGLPKAEAAAHAAFMHAELGLRDPLSLQAEIGTLFGVRSAV